MTTPAPTTITTTNNSDGQQITRTTWTVGDHTLTRIECNDCPDHWATSRASNDAPYVYEDTAHWHDDTAPVTYDVNWSALGDRTPTEARAYAARLMLAATAAEAFTTIRAQHQ